MATANTILVDDGLLEALERICISLLFARSSVHMVFRLTPTEPTQTQDAFPGMRRA